MSEETDKAKSFWARPESLVLYISMFVMGSCGIAYEYTFSKTAADLLGNSPRQWAIVIGLMMLFMGIGADLQKHFSDDALFDKFVFFEILLGLVGGTGTLILIYVFGFSPNHYVLVQYLIVVSVGLLIGLEIPIITRLNEVYSDSLRFNLGAVLKMDYLGSFAGSLFWIFVLPVFFSMVQTGLVLGVLNLLVVVVTIFYFRRLIRRLRLLLSITFVGLALLGGLLYRCHDLTSHAEQYLFRNRVVVSKTTQFQHIVVTESPTGRIDCFINANLQFSSFDEHIYHDWLVHPAMHLAGQRKRVLVLGGGDGLAVREVLKYPDVEQIVLCDIDPEMTRLATENPILRRLNEGSLQHAKVSSINAGGVTAGEAQDILMSRQRRSGPKPPGVLAEVKIVNIDAMQFLVNLTGRFDVIIADFPDPNSRELAKLYSKEFYQLVGEHLSADGIFIQQSTSPSFAREAYLCIGRTLEAAGLHAVPVHDHVPSFGDWGWWVAGNISADQIRERLGKLDQLTVPTRYLSPEVIRSGMVFGKDRLVTNETGISQVTNDRVYQYYVAGWQETYQ